MNIIIKEHLDILNEYISYINRYDINFNEFKINHLKKLNFLFQKLMI